jgi:cytochrome c oxidase subunit 1
MILAGICGCLLLLAFAAFLFNVVMTFGVKGLIGIYSPAKSDTSDCVPAPQEA